MQYGLNPRSRVGTPMVVPVPPPSNSLQGEKPRTARSHGLGGRTVITERTTLNSASGSRPKPPKAPTTTDMIANTNTNGSSTPFPPPPSNQEALESSPVASSSWSEGIRKQVAALQTLAQHMQSEPGSPGIGTQERAGEGAVETPESVLASIASAPSVVQRVCESLRNNKKAGKAVDELASSLLVAVVGLLAGSGAGSGGGAGGAEGASPERPRKGRPPRAPESQARIPSAPWGNSTDSKWALRLCKTALRLHASLAVSPEEKPGEVGSSSSSSSSASSSSAATSPKSPETPTKTGSGSVSAGLAARTKSQEALVKVSKLLFRLSKAEKHDELFRTVGLLDAVCDVLKGGTLPASRTSIEGGKGKPGSSPTDAQGQKPVQHAGAGAGAGSVKTNGLPGARVMAEQQGEAFLFLTAFLKNSSLNSDNATLLGDIGAIGILSELLGSDGLVGSSAEAQVLIQVVAALRNLAVSSRVHSQVVRAEAIPALARLLRVFPKADELTLNISRLLAKLSLSDECLIAMAESPPTLLQICNTLDVNVKKPAVVVRLTFLLGNLCAKFDKARVFFFFECEGAALLPRILEEYLQRDRTLAIAHAQAAVAKGETNEKTKSDSSSETEEVLIKSVRLLANAAINTTVGTMTAATSTMVLPLLDLLGAKRISSSEELVLNTVAAVTNLLYFDSPSNLLLVQQTKKTLCKLLHLLLTDPSNPECLMETVRAMGNLSRHRDVRLQMRDTGTDALVVALLDHSYRDLVYYATGALVNLSADRDCAPSLLSDACSGGVAERLSELLIDAGRGNDWSLVGLVAKVITNLAIDTSLVWLPGDLASLHGALLKVAEMIAEGGQERQKQKQTADDAESLSELNSLLLRLHDTLPPPRFVCPSPDCSEIFTTDRLLLTHLKDKHADLLRTLTSSGSPCSISSVEDEKERDTEDHHVHPPAGRTTLLEKLNGPEDEEAEGGDADQLETTAEGTRGLGLSSEWFGETDTEGSRGSRGGSPQKKTDRRRSAGGKSPDVDADGVQTLLPFGEEALSKDAITSAGEGDLSKRCVGAEGVL
uniref:C2H2-type domain-containing protein n=1 Tax=Chromera velia CCMP2878 TaxID=1169474 RepID=A0A0G4GB43_9ALVE|eukprot:Cvel_21028.t1-p1 / transcript=Cvel_21028.t1 / gene=Cvel_21028 / organism=Chromera_velia_CCMP2878 / gene_product=Armadillo repeat-containing protein 2, putative / transcript_product=Armadillo repeat-containing protein 2, putative / location=Cvel_scaffold1939:3922-11954(-) / protein_length=1053 / sequence_SO=supercontig / SO=protein_coding / is_pseudo=false